MLEECAAVGASPLKTGESLSACGMGRSTRGEVWSPVSGLIADQRQGLLHIRGGTDVKGPVILLEGPFTAGDAGSAITDPKGDVVGILFLFGNEIRAMPVSSLQPAIGLLVADRE